METTNCSTSTIRTRRRNIPLIGHGVGFPWFKVAVYVTDFIVCAGCLRKIVCCLDPFIVEAIEYVLVMPSMCDLVNQGSTTTPYIDRQHVKVAIDDRVVPVRVFIETSGA